MTIRRLTDADVHQFNEVQAVAYIGKVDWANERTVEGDNTWGAFNGERLVATLIGSDFENYFYNGRLKCLGIGGVASRPESRRAGAVRAIFNEVLLQGRGRWDIGILHPFSANYYRKFGYEPISDCVRLEVKFSDVFRTEAGGSTELYIDENTDKLLELYNRIASKGNLTFARTDNRYFNPSPYETAKYTYIWKNSAEEYKAYVNFEVNRSIKTVFVKEIGFDGREALFGIMGLLNAYSGNYHTLIFEKLPSDSPIRDLCAERQKIIRTSYLTGSVRIIDAQSVFSKIKPVASRSGSVSVKLTDILPWNNGIFDIEYSGGETRVTARDSGDYDFEMSICAAAKVFLSGEPMNADRLEFIDGCRVINQNDDIFDLTAPKPAFFCDGF